MGCLDSMTAIADDVAACRACPRLVQWREDVAVAKRAAYRDDDYWGRGVPGFGDPTARILIVGLAPAAHGANRTGRMFTGDRSGDWLYRALHRAGLAALPTSEHRNDGQQLTSTYISAVARCAPPANHVEPSERDACAGFLDRELALLNSLTVVVCLGGVAYQAMTTRFAVRPRPRFGHGVEVTTAAGPTLLCSFHPSQQNTFTGKLTEPMLDAVFSRATALASLQL
jgi:uracil-DNA glycosylase